MEESLKYFVPEISDIRVGYECEIWWNYNYLPKDEWCSVKVLQGSTVDFDLYDFTSRINKNEIRVPYLTKEQIEADGWFHRENTNIFIKGKIGLAYNFDKHLICIGYENGHILFNGECKDINTFRYICKLLKINE